MSSINRVPEDEAAVRSVSQEVKNGVVVNEKPEEPYNQESPPPVDIGQESFGAPPDDSVKYVGSHPVIKTGNNSQRKLFTTITDNLMRCRCLQIPCLYSR
jgi:hypothetical protein